MRTRKSVVIYIIILILELFRYFSFVYIQKRSLDFGSFMDFTGIIILLLPSIIFFLILNDEEEFHKFLNILVVFKLLSMLGFYLYCRSIVARSSIMIEVLGKEKFVTYIILPLIIFIIDMFILVFSFLKEKALCKSYQ